MKKPSIFKYLDYREFLKDWLEYLKSNQSSFSLRLLAKKAKVSVSSISMILNGQRALSDHHLVKIEPFLKLDSQEISYLKLLIIIADSKDNEEKLVALKKLQRFNDYKLNHNAEFEAYKYLGKWFYVVIREMININDFSLDIHWIREKLNKNLRSHEVEEAIKFLLDNGFIEKIGHKTLKAEKLLQCKDGIYKLSLSDFHKQMLNLAVDSIEKTPSDERLILGHTIAMSKQQYQEASKILLDALDKIEKLSTQVEDKGKKENVYHIGLLNFPVTDVKYKKEG